MNSRASLHSIRRFDQDSGLVFQESVVRIAPARDRQWATFSPVSLRPDFLEGRTEGKEYPRAVSRYSKFVEERRLGARVAGVRGTRSLIDTAKEYILQHLDKLSIEGIQNLPEHLARSIWDDINKRFNDSSTMRRVPQSISDVLMRRRNIVNFHLWTIFSRVLHKAENATMSLFRYRQAISQPCSSLQVYTEPLISTPFHFLTYLSITTTFPFAELVKLSDMRNIAILEVIRPDSEITCPSFPAVRDRLVRVWSEAAVTTGAFPVLRILKFWNHVDVTDASVEYLNRFPALAVFDVKRCSITSKGGASAACVGWTKKRTSALVLLEKKCALREADIRESTGLSPKLRSSLKPIVNSEPIVKISGRETERLRFRDLKLNTSTTNPIDISQAAETWHDLELSAFQEERMPKTWEFRAFTAFARIGELREDADLEIAGLPKIKIATMAAEDLICPIPMACLRLGPLGAAQRRHYLSSQSYNAYHEESDDVNWVFLRTTIPSNSKILGPPTHIHPTSSSGTRLLKRRGSKDINLRPTKHQKVSDLLISFT